MFLDKKLGLSSDGIVGALIIFALLALAVSPVEASEIFNFSKITNNNPENIASQLQVDVMAVGTRQVSFKFTNSVGIAASSVREIYFDDANNDLLQDLVVANNGTTFLGAGSLNPNPVLPGGNGNPINFVVDDLLSSGTQNGPFSRGLNGAGEDSTFTYNLVGTKTFAEVITALNNERLRIGLHVRSIGTNGGSDSFLNNPGDPSGGNPVPEPSTVALMGLGLGAIAMRYRKKMKKLK